MNIKLKCALTLVFGGFIGWFGCLTHLSNTKSHESLVAPRSSPSPTAAKIDAAKQLGCEALFDQYKNIPTGWSKRARFVEMLGSAGKNDVQLLKDMLAKKNQGTRLSQLELLLVHRRIGELTGYAGLTEIWNPKSMLSPSEEVKARLAGYVSTDPQGAIKHWTELPDTGSKAGLSSSLIHALAETSPQSAVDFFSTMSGDQKARSIGSTLGVLADSQGLQSASDFAGQLIQSAHKKSDIVAKDTAAVSFTDLLLKTDPTEARKWIEEQPAQNLSAASVSRCALNIFGHGKETEALNWSMAQSVRSDNGAILFQTAKEIAVRNPEALGKWINDTSNFPNRDMILELMVNETRKFDNESANAWERYRQSKSEEDMLQSIGTLIQQ